MLDADSELPVFAKLSPNVTDLREIAAAALAAGATGLTLVNTLLGLVVDAEQRRPALGAGGGGLSGPAIKPVALRAVHDVARAHPGVPIIGTGGVTTGVDAVEMLLAGASAVGVGTATFHDPRASLRVLDELVGWCATTASRASPTSTGAMEDPDVTDVRDRLALALDVGGPADAEAVARRLAPWFGIAKVGLELYAEAGPDVFDRLRDLGIAVFADLKLYDIPTTVERAARTLGRRGVDFLNFPAAGGATMLEPASPASPRGRETAGIHRRSRWR